MTDIVFAPLFDLLTAFAVLGTAGVAVGAGVLAVPSVADAFRQRAYDRRAATELIRLELIPTRLGVIDAKTAVAVVRGLHPRQRRGFDPLRVGWPSSELRVVWRDGELAWQVEAPRQLVHEFAVSHRALHVVVGVRSVEGADVTPAATAVGRLAQLDSWPLRAPEVPGDRPLHRLAAALEAAVPSGIEVRFRVLLRPVPAAAWRRTIEPDASSSESTGSIVRHAFVDGLLLRPSGSGRPTTTSPTPLERDAQARKRAGALGFDTRLLIEVAGTSFDEAKALLWELTDATDALADAGQQIRWEVVRGAPSRVPRSRLADWEVAQLWYLPDETFDQSELPRPRPLAGAMPPEVPLGAGIAVGANGDRPLVLPIVALRRHLAVVGSTGSGKSTLLLQLVLGLLETSWGATVIDPHGDLVADILARVPHRRAGRMRVLRLADREHPRGFNFLERRNAAEAQLVTSEFVELFADLWPRFCGPKMQHYLRNALLTLLADPDPQTVLELVRILSDEAFRRPYIERAADPVLKDFWRTQWPGRGAAERDPSVAAVQNKLGAFVAYDSVRHIVGQGASTVRPRTTMDRGDFLVVDLSQVGGDNASIFGGMLIARYYIDALGRQGTDPASRRPHLLVVDEAPRFSTRALGRIEVEGRKFGLALAVATQSLGGLGAELRDVVIANAGTLALVSPGIEDVRDLAPLFAPLTAADLLGMRTHEMVVKTAGPRDRSAVYGGIVSPPGDGDPEIAAAIITASDQRDARRRAVAAAEVIQRLTAEPAGDGAYVKTVATVRGRIPNGR
jgi:uncharacterized protein DUF87